MVKRKIISLVLSLAVALSMTVAANASGVENDGVDAEINALLNEINAEYGTEFRLLSEDYFTEHNLFYTTPRESAPVDMDSLKIILTAYAEEFAAKNQECLEETSDMLPDNSVADTNSMVSSNPILASTPIDYAIAMAEAYSTKDQYGNTVWGEITKQMCYTNVYLERWFLAPNPSVTRIDFKRTLRWSGTGDYGAYINGQQFYLSSGTQYAEMYIGDYV